MVHHLLPLNIRLVFVFDGPNRPGKNGKKPAGVMRPEDTKLLKQMLEVLAVPYVVAPAEAEAECAKLQMQGIVDAVWSEDSDCLMFGCTFLIKDHRVPKVRSKGKPEQIRRPDSNHVGDTERSMTHVRVYKAAYLKENFGLERYDFLLAALLSGNDYDNHKGVRGCSMRIAMDAAKAGYGASLWDSSTRLSDWPRGGLAGFLAKQHGNIDFPPTFPDQMVFRHCCWPKISSETEMSRVRQLVSSDMPINEIDLQKFMGPKFNLWAEYYLQRITPIFLVRTLAQTQPGQEKSISSFEVERVFSRGHEVHGASTSKVRFVPRYLTTIDLSFNRDGSPSDPELLRECITLNAILINGLGKQFLEKPATSSRKGLKRQVNEDSLDSEQPASKRSKVLEPTPDKALFPPTPISQVR
jgi:Holliday junction resolvase YEN1